MNTRLAAFLLACTLVVSGALVAPVAATTTSTTATTDFGANAAQNASAATAQNGSTATAQNGSTAAAAQNTSVSNATLSGDGVYSSAHSNQTFLWRGEPTNVTVTVQTDNVSAKSYGVCVFLPSAPENQRELACEHPRIPGDATREVTVPIQNWPGTPVDDPTAEQPIVVRLDGGFRGDDLGSTSTSARLVAKDGNLDGDDLSNGREAELGTDLTRKDTDGDSLWDDEEVRSHGTDPLEVDSDADGLSDPREIARGTNPNDSDSDGDGLSDGAEVDEYDTNPDKQDSDGDGLSDGAEVDEHDTDPNEPDSDDDGLLDGAEVDEYDTDPSAQDSDDDGLDDGTEIELGTNPNGANGDADADLLGDSTEVALGTDPTNPLSPWLAVFALAAAAAGGVGMYVTGTRVEVESRRYFDRDVPVPALSMPDDADESSPGTADAPPPSDAPPTSVANAPSVDAGFDGENDLPGPFLTDEDRVRQLLEDAGGYLRQQAIVQETGWSKSKVSRLLSRMEDEETVTKINVGRENIISLPGEEPSGTKSALQKD